MYIHVYVHVYILLPYRDVYLAIIWKFFYCLCMYIHVYACVCSVLNRLLLISRSSQRHDRQFPPVAERPRQTLVYTCIYTCVHVCGAVCYMYSTSQMQGITHDVQSFCSLVFSHLLVRSSFPLSVGRCCSISPPSTETGPSQDSKSAYACV